MVKVKELKQLKVGKIIENIDLKKYTTYRAGGIGRVLVIPKDVKSLIKLMDYIKKNNVKYKVLGNGSNLVFSDGLYDGILIKLYDFDNIEIKGTTITFISSSIHIDCSAYSTRNTTCKLNTS